jgi:hypothetical protein
MSYMTCIDLYTHIRVDIHVRAHTYANVCVCVRAPISNFSTVSDQPKSVAELSFAKFQYWVSIHMSRIYIARRQAFIHMHMCITYMQHVYTHIKYVDRWIARQIISPCEAPLKRSRYLSYIHIYSLYLCTLSLAPPQLWSFPVWPPLHRAHTLTWTSRGALWSCQMRFASVGASGPACATNTSEYGMHMYLYSSAYVYVSIFFCLCLCIYIHLPRPMYLYVSICIYIDLPMHPFILGYVCLSVCLSI